MERNHIPSFMYREIVSRRLVTSETALCGVGEGICFIHRMILSYDLSQHDVCKGINHLLINRMNGLN